MTPDLTLYRILIETHHEPLIGRYSEWSRHRGPSWTRHDVVVLAEDDQEARLIALRHMSTTGDRRRVVPGSLVPVTIEPRVVMQHEVTW